MLKIKISTLEQDFYKKFMKRILKRIIVFVTFDSTKLNLNNINDPVKNRASSSDKKNKPKEKVVAPICG